MTMAPLTSSSSYALSLKAALFAKHPIFTPLEMVLGEPRIVTLSILLLVGHEKMGDSECTPRGLKREITDRIDDLHIRLMR